MSLNGNLRTMDLADVLGWIANRRKTGTLHVESRALRKGVMFNEGLVQSSWSNDPRESLGQFLVRDRLITEEALFKALLRQEQEGRLLGQILVSEGALQPDRLRKAVGEKALETVYELFLWHEGRFDFQEGEWRRDPLVDLSLDIETLIHEGTRRREQWDRICESFPSLETSFRSDASPAELHDGKEHDAYILAVAGKTLAEISLETRCSQFETALRLFQLCSRGLLLVDQVRDADASTDAVTAIHELLRAAGQLFQDGRLDAAFDAYENVLVLDRLNQHAKLGLVAVAEARQRERLARRVPLDKTPLLLKGSVALTQQRFDPQEGFVLSRINGQWNVRSILKVCPMSEEDALLIFARLLDRKVIALE